jgi:hypothetical protein
MVVGAGLFILRYVSAKTAAPKCPFVTVMLSPKAGRGISLISVPGGDGDTLSAPGDSIIVRAEKSGALDLTICAVDSSTSLDAELRLERILTVDGERSRPVHEGRGQAQPAEPQLRIAAHVSRRGDVAAEPGEWMCGPDWPMPIEGIRIDWPNKPPDVDLKYSVSVRRLDQKRVLGGVAGSFAGTRGESAPIVGVNLALTGPGASRYELRGDALFLGAAAASRRGRQLSFTGPTAREPLVGLRLAAVTAEAFSRRGPHLTTVSTDARTQLGKVRVYRPGSLAMPRST